MRRLRALVPFIAVAVTACHDEPGLATAPRFEIVDGAHGAGNPHFYFLPPLSAEPAVTGALDASLSPEVQVCTWAGQACLYPIVADFLDVRVTGDHYTVNWKTFGSGLMAGRTYRIRVLAGLVELGYLDVVAGATAAVLKSVDPAAAYPLVIGRTLPIKFRIEQGALPSGRIVFTSIWPEPGMYGVRPDGTGRFRVNSQPWAAYSDLSPDGRWLAYAGNDQGNGIVGVQPIDGGPVRVLYTCPGQAGGVSWSPDGDRLAFGMGCSGTSPAWMLWVVDTAPGATAALLGEGHFPTWSPDGTRIAYFGPSPSVDRKVWIVNADGSNPVMVPGDASETHPAWISNTRLVISRSEGTALSGSLYLVDVDGTNLVKLTNGTAEIWPRPSPDRRWVVFWTNVNPSFLSVVSVDGRVRFQIPTATQGQLFPSWGPEAPASSGP